MTFMGQAKSLAITIGDPAGIGPELALRVAENWSTASGVALRLIGDAALLKRVSQLLGLALPPVIHASEIDDDTVACGIVSIGHLKADEVVPGQWSVDSGQASYEWVRFAIEQAIAKKISSIVTGPIQKEAWHSAGIAYPGHTELLADMTQTPEYRMMLTAPEISCVLVTIHVPLADVAASLTTESIYQSIQLASEALTRAHCRPARVTVCGLNPHAGENGLFSHGEEERLIVPAIKRAIDEGMLVCGPLSPDTAFVPAQRQRTDVYVCMYHDQGLIPLKALAFDDAVNVTLGLPIVRTSVDHGTAMDIAWTGKASDKSLRAAIAMAIGLI
jgi:4-phospho-D-threonate 3-dehydrogenase / 4-phospho-D-erythronate 3-dehydrogenase